MDKSGTVVVLSRCKSLLDYKDRTFPMYLALSLANFSGLNLDTYASNFATANVTRCSLQVVLATMALRTEEKP